ncbi:MAG: hypothetical protein IKS77_05150, partial [Spirochaetales bacterium]|nr:hypothetical protein [Spirochaetales bacterium]
MKNRRHSAILALLLTSVFLCLITACGVPTYIIPTVNVSNISKSYHDDGDDEEIVTDSFQLSYSSESLGTDGRVGLLLLYSRENLEPNKQNTLISKFKNSYSPTQYDGVPISASDNEAVVTATEYELYPLYSSSARFISAPDYSHAMDNSGAFSYLIKLKYDKRDSSLHLKIGDSGEDVLYFASSFPPTSNYIGLYAAVSVQSPNYSNIYWSSLFFVGYI